MQTDSTSSRLEHQGAHALFVTALSVLLGFLLSVVVARSLGPSGKGIFDLASATTGLFALVLGASLNSAVTHHIAHHGARPARLAGQLALWAIAAGLLTGAILSSSPAFFVKIGLLPVHHTSFWMAFVALSATFGIWAAGLRGILIGQDAIILANRIDVSIKGALLAAFGTLAFSSSKPDVRGFAIVAAGAATALTLSLIVATRDRSEDMPNPWPRLLAIALPVHGTNILHFLNQRVDVFFIQAFHKPSDVGIYALAVSLAQCVLLQSSALAQPLLPRVSSASSLAYAISATAATCRLFVALGLTTTCGILLLGGWLVPLVFGRGFFPSLPPLFLLLPGMLFFGLTNILISYFVGRGRSRLNLWISLATLIVTLLGNILLTRQYGPIGAAVTSTLAYSLAGGLSLWFFYRDAGVSSWAEVLPKRADWARLVMLTRSFKL